MEIKIKLLKGGKLPEKKTDGAACYDCYARLDNTIGKNETIIIPLGFAIEVPDGYYAEIRGRSGLSTKGLVCMIGTVDSDYRGEVGAIITNISDEPFTFNVGDRMAQMMIKTVLDTNLVVTDCLSDTERGTGGFGSTGK